MRTDERGSLSLVCGNGRSTIGKGEAAGSDADGGCYYAGEPMSFFCSKTSGIPWADLVKIIENLFLEVMTFLVI
jgi:hypothetical protein